MQHIPQHTFDFNFERTEFSDETYSVTGRALTYATKFENEVKAFAKFLDIRSSVEEMFRDENSFKEFVEKSKNFMPLNSAIYNLKMKGDFHNILIKAKNARNSIAHDITVRLLDSSDDEERRTELTRELEEKIEAVAEAERVILLAQTIINKEPHPSLEYLIDYPRKVINWVIEI